MIRLLKSTTYPSFSPGLAGNVMTPTVTRSGATATRVNEEGLVAICPANSPRLDYDPVTKACKGLLIEWQRVNLVLQSQNLSVTWVLVGTPTLSTAAVSQGALTLDLAGDDSSSALEGYTQTVTFTGNAVKAVSVFMKAATAPSSVVQLRDTTAVANRLFATITWASGVPSVAMATGTLLGTDDYGNGIYRFRFVSTSVTAANTNSLQFYPATDASSAVGLIGQTYVGGMQAEDAATCSSYIPTTTATVTRNLDDINKTPITAWLNPVEGSLVVSAMFANIGHDVDIGTIASLTDDTTNEEIKFHVSRTGGNRSFTVIDGGANQAVLSPASVGVNGAPMTMAGAYKANDFALSTDGGTIQTDASGTLPTVTRLRLGAHETGVDILGGWLRGFSYYRTRLSNGDLQTLSGGGAITTQAAFSFDFTGAVLEAQTGLLTKPRITYQDHCRGLIASAVAVSTEVADFPRDAPLRQETWEAWKMSAVPATWRVNLGSQKAFSYILIVATPGATASLEWSNDDSTYFWLGGPLTLTGPADLFLFPSVTAQYVRVTIDGTIVPVSVIKVGPVLTVERHVAPGHGPITLARDTDLATSRSPSGHLLGSTIRKRGFKSAAEFHNITPSWYRANFDPFVADARLWAFGFAWNPQDAPTDVAYCWMEANPDIAPRFKDVPTFDVSFNMVGFDG